MSKRFDNPKEGGAFIMFQAEGHTLFSILDEVPGWGHEANCHQKVRTSQVSVFWESTFPHVWFLSFESNTLTFRASCYFSLLDIGNITGKRFQH